ncbi:hypothetical protein ELS19_10320 [Halogeometricum borinquense]|uniref:Uncharacterized protein n=1 Tax=Halogeometricum borinquense TaxID=60847 RepID=A0A482T9B2_9EURY|nr:hypothetical protein [Halogeometricum borinquense]RYJ14310.1 hypothetical protein ELS19_10320 [Halogeometricum borinquense]
MKRRALLASLGAGSVLGFAGCLSDTGTQDGSDGVTETTNRTASGTETDMNTPNTPNTPASLPCPPHTPTHDEAVCSHTVDPETAQVYLEPRPSRRTLADGLPSEQISLTLHNQSDTELTFNPYSWTIRRHSQSEWQQLQLQPTADGTLTLSSGESQSWTLQEVINSGREETDLNPGTYTAEIGVPNPETDAWISCIAIIRLDPSTADETPSGMSEDGNDTVSSG